MMKTEGASKKRHKIYQTPTVKIQPLPTKSHGSTTSANIQEQKDRFLKHGKTPVFVVQGDTSTVDELASKVSGKIRFDLFGEAQYILQTVKQKYGVGEHYLEHIYGPHIEQDEANQILFEYIKENSLQESLAVYWSNELNCSARMVWKGYSFKCNRPELRKYSLWLNGTCENPYLRRYGLRCLLDHEIGTHFYRSFNDGLQPWFSDRKKFGLRSAGSFESLCTEEGLAAINTTLRAKEKYLWLSALVYYTACKSTEMTFKQLFDHLGQFLDSPEQRWKHVMRVKRSLVDPNDLGGFGKDQCYFEGAVTILRNLDNINFQHLMSGKICYDEVDRIKRIARTGSIALPFIMRNMSDYRKQLKRMASINGLHLPHPTYMPSRVYLQRLKEREAGIMHRRKVRIKLKKSRSSLSNQSSSTGSASSTSDLNEEKEEEAVMVQKSPPTQFTQIVPLATRPQTQHGVIIRHEESDLSAKIPRSVFETPMPPAHFSQAKSAASHSLLLCSRKDSSSVDRTLSVQDSCSDFSEASARSCFSHRQSLKNSSPQMSFLPQLMKDRPQTAPRLPFRYSVSDCDGKLEITQIQADTLRSGAAADDCDGLLCSRPFSSSHSLDDSCQTTNIQSWVLTSKPTSKQSLIEANPALISSMKSKYS